MLTVIITFIIILTVIALMAVGVMFKRKPIAGSCGGLANIGVEKACDCDNPCENRRLKNAIQSSVQKNSPTTILRGVKGQITSLKQRENIISRAVDTLQPHINFDAPCELFIVYFPKLDRDNKASLDSCELFVGFKKDVYKDHSKLESLTLPSSMYQQITLDGPFLKASSLFWDALSSEKLVLKLRDDMPCLEVYKFKNESSTQHQVDLYLATKN